MQHPLQPPTPSPRADRVGTALAVGSAAVAPLVAWLAVRAGLGLPARSPAADLVVLMLWSVSEEVVFRGALQPWLAARIVRATRRPRLRAGVLGVTLSNLLCSVAFVAAHLLQHTVVAALSVFPVSLLLGAVRERTRRLWPAVVLHAWFNAALYAASWFAASSATAARG